MEQSVAAIAEYLKGKLIGDGTVLIRGVNTLEAAQSGEMSFADTPQRLAQALTTASSALIVSSDVGELGGKSGISVPNPKLAFALVLDLFHPSVLADGRVLDMLRGQAADRLAEGQVRRQRLYGEGHSVLPRGMFCPTIIFSWTGVLL